MLTDKRYQRSRSLIISEAVESWIIKGTSTSKKIKKLGKSSSRWNRSPLLGKKVELLEIRFKKDK